MSGISYWSVAIVASVVAAYAAAAGIAFELLGRTLHFNDHDNRVLASVGWPVLMVFALTVFPLGRVWSFGRAVAKRRHQDDALPKARVL